jgi:Tol biopolymer transport system component
LDLEKRTTRQVSFGVERYVSVSASADGSRLAATVAQPEASLYSIPLVDGITEERDVVPYPTPTVRALAPRFRGESLYYLSSRGGGDGLWRLTNGKAAEIWKGADSPLAEPAAVSPDGTSLAVVLRKDGRARVQVLSADGAELRELTEAIEVRGSAAWSPDSRWVVIGGSGAQGQGLFKIPSRGGQPVRLVSGQALNPVWSPDGRTIVYAGPDISTFQPLLAVSPEGKPIAMPAIQVERSGERARFLPDGSGLVYLRGLGAEKDFWLLDMASGMSRQLARFSNAAEIRTFDVTADGKRVVFDRIRENSNIVLIDLLRKH